MKKANQQRELDALAFNVLTSFRGGMQWTDWHQTTRTRRGKQGLGTGTFSEIVKRLTAQQRVQIDEHGCYRVIDDAVGGLSDTLNSAAGTGRFLEVSSEAFREAEAEIEKLRAENKQLLDWILGDTDALTCLQAIYQSSESSEHTKIKAAASALPFERPKLTATGLVVVDFRERVRQARLKATAKLIEHMPDEPA